jgi:hypothetical protein
MDQFDRVSSVQLENLPGSPPRVLRISSASTMANQAFADAVGNQQMLAVRMRGYPGGPPPSEENRRAHPNAIQVLRRTTPCDADYIVRIKVGHPVRPLSRQVDK